jgi:hypothetical protein
LDSKEIKITSFGKITKVKTEVKGDVGLIHLQLYKAKDGTRLKEAERVEIRAGQEGHNLLSVKAMSTIGEFIGFKL